MRVPLATYRIQLQPDFDFEDAASILDYLSTLGISDLYFSPIFRPRKGSLHGYDVIDPNQVNPELGGQEGLERLAAVIKERDLGWIQDIVPNHMAFHGENSFLMDILENGEASAYYDYFDIQWNHPFEAIRGKLLAPFLGKFYAECLENGEITLHFDASGLSVRYYDICFPLKIESYVQFFTHGLESLKKLLGGDHPDIVRMFGVLYALKNLPGKEARLERADQVRFIKKMLQDLHTQSAEIRNFIDENLTAFNGKPGHPESFHLLDALLSAQLFRLLFWKVATEEVNYRRFFNVNDLISLRMEEEGVFERTHSLILRLVEERKITGLRVDHIDGLYDPAQYLHRLRNKAPDIYLVVEKILGSEERLPSGWPVQGTTGYDFLASVNALFCDRRNWRRINRIFSRYTGFDGRFSDLVVDKKRMIIGRHMAGEIDRLATLLKNISARDRHGIDITLYGLKRALVELLAFFPVYRTYINPDIYSEEDRWVMKEAIGKAKKAVPAMLHELEFIENFLLVNFRDYATEEEKMRWIHFVMRFQQLSGPLMAKGFEDTTLYIYSRLISLNDVGCNPNQFGITLKEFHKFQRYRAQQSPLSMNATATHDTKRGEDIRARLNILSELPDEWQSHLRNWTEINRQFKRTIGENEVPDKNDEYFFYQTLLGAMPFFDSELSSLTARLKEYMIKAVREAKVHTAWLKPDSDYESGCLAFINDVMNPDNGFLDAFLPFQKKVARYGMFQSLSQVLIKMTAPGIPDFYQGSELWDLNLVDPDNRRPVDYSLRHRFLREIREGESLPLIETLLEAPEDGKIKLFTIHRALQLRKQQRELFERGDHVPLEPDGVHQSCVIAYARRYSGQWLLCATPRRITRLIPPEGKPVGSEVWSDTTIRLPRGAPSLWHNVFSGQEVIAGSSGLHLADVLRHFPVALLFGP